MSEMVIEVHEKKADAEKRVQYWRQRGFTVEQINSYAGVQWKNHCSDGKGKEDTAWGESDVWTVVARE